MKNANKFYVIIFLVFSLFVPSIKAMYYQKENVRMSLDYLKKGDNERYLNIKVLTRRNRQLVFVANSKIDFYLTEISKDNYLGSINTDTLGTATFLLPKAFYDLSDSMSTYLFLAELTNHPEFNDEVSDLLIRDVNLQVTFSEIDSQKMVEVEVYEFDESGNAEPVEDVEIKVLVKRPFSDLPITDPDEYISTDNDGFISIPFPDNLPGEVDSPNLDIIVRIQNSDEFGTVVQMGTKPWGTPIEIYDDTLKRSLWAASANAPIPIVLFVNGLIAVVWGVIFLIFYRIYKISKV